MKPRRRLTASVRTTGAPFLHRIESLPEKFDRANYPFDIRAYGGTSLHEQSHGEWWERRSAGLARSGISRFVRLLEV